MAQLVKERGLGKGRGLLRTILLPIPMGILWTLALSPTEIAGCLVGYGLAYRHLVGR